VTLVAAFRATLEELDVAEVLIHVLDITHPCGYEQAEEVNRTIKSLGLASKPVVTALNKIDQLRGVERPEDIRTGDMGVDVQTLLDQYPEAVPTSATRRWGLDELLGRVEKVLAESNL
jgi:GTP-binding protein HflX